MATRRKWTTAVVVVCITAATFAIVFWLSGRDQGNTASDRLFFASMAALFAFLFSAFVAGAAISVRQAKPIRVSVRVPHPSGDGALIQAMGAIGFMFEEERAEAQVFLQSGLDGLLMRRRIIVTKTPDGIVVAGPTGFVDKFLSVFGGEARS